MAAVVVVEKFERRIAVGAKKDRRRPRMSDSIVRIVTNFVVVGGSRVGWRYQTLLFLISLLKMSVRRTFLLKN